MIGEYIAPNDFEKNNDFPGHQWEVPPPLYRDYGITMPNDEEQASFGIEDVQNALDDFLQTYGADLLDALAQQGYAPSCGTGRMGELVAPNTPGIYVLWNGNQMGEDDMALVAVNPDRTALQATWMRVNFNFPGHNQPFTGWFCPSPSDAGGRVNWVWDSAGNPTIQLDDGRVLSNPFDLSQQIIVVPPTATPIPPQSQPTVEVYAQPNAQPAEPSFWDSLFGGSDPTPTSTPIPSPTASNTPLPTYTNTPISEEERQANQDFNWFVYGPICLIGGAGLLGIFLFLGSRSSGQGDSEEESNDGQYDEEQWVEEEPPPEEY